MKCSIHYPVSGIKRTEGASAWFSETNVFRSVHGGTNSAQNDTEAEGF